MTFSITPDGRILTPVTTELAAARKVLGRLEALGDRVDVDVVERCRTNVENLERAASRRAEESSTSRA
jgi:hypothetical protein